jgi:hypothetical protein
MPFRKPSVVLFIVLALFTVFSLISAQSDIPLPLPSEPDGGSAQFQDRSSVELLTNGGFEVDGNGDKLPDGWKAKNTNVAKSDKLKCNKPDKVVAYTGSCAFQFSGNPTGEESKLSQDIAAIESIVNGSTLTLSAYLDPKGGVAGSKIASLKVKLSDSSKLKLDLRLPSADSIASYTQFTNTTPIMIPSGVFITEAKLDLKYGEVNGKYLIDDVSLTVSVPDPTATPVTPTKVFTATATATNTSTVEASQTPSLTPTNTFTSTPTATSTNTPTPTEIPDTLTQLSASDGTLGDAFGISASLSADGKTALIGAFGDMIDGKPNQGSAYVFVRSNGVWTEQQKLVASDGEASDRFGVAVSLSADGNVALVGAHYDTVSGKSMQGSAYVFVRSNGVWTEQQKLVASDGAAQDNFGGSVTLSSDGNTVVVGADGDDVEGKSNQGSAYVFVRSNGVWTEQQKLVASDSAAQDNFGSSVSLSSDGYTVAIGAYGDDIEGKSNQGSAYMFVRNNGLWAEQQKLVASDGTAQDNFGLEVALSADSSTVLVGVPFENISGSSYQGSAYIYARSGGMWVEQQKLIASDGASDDYFGTSVSLSADGSTASVGAYRDNIGVKYNQGSVYIYTRNGGIWTQKQQLFDSDGAEDDSFGIAVSLSANGRLILVGAYRDDVGGITDNGSAWIIPIP